MDMNYKGLFKGWEIAIAKKLVNQFRSRAEFLKRVEFEDLLQECLTHWFFVKDQYDSSRGSSQKNFMSRIIRNKLANIAQRISADKRKALYQSVSLEKPVGNDEDAPTLIETIAESDDAPATFILQTGLKIDLSKAFQQLTPKQKTLCRLLGEEGLTIKEASEYLRIPRGTIYEEIKRIRAIFKKEKLEDYLK